MIFRCIHWPRVTVLLVNCACWLSIYEGLLWLFHALGGAMQ